MSEVGDDFEPLWLRKIAEKKSPASQIEIPRNCAGISPFPKTGGKQGFCVVNWKVAWLDMLLFKAKQIKKPVYADVFCQDMLVEWRRSRGREKFGERRSTALPKLSTVYYVLEVLGFPANLRQVFLQWKPYFEKVSSLRLFYFKARDRALQGILGAAEVWYASPFDGDTTLMP